MVQCVYEKTCVPAWKYQLAVKLQEQGGETFHATTLVKILWLQDTLDMFSPCNTCNSQTVMLPDVGMANMYLSVLKPEHVDQGCCMERHLSLFLEFFCQLVFPCRHAHMFSVTHHPCISTCFCGKRFYYAKLVSVLYGWSSSILPGSKDDSHSQTCTESKLGR